MGGRAKTRLITIIYFNNSMRNIESGILMHILHDKFLYIPLRR